MSVTNFFFFFLLGILSRTECCQLLLLCVACLVNLVRELELERKEEEMQSDIVEVFTNHRTVERLLDAVKRRGPNISVFLQVSLFYIFGGKFTWCFKVCHLMELIIFRIKHYIGITFMKILKLGSEVKIGKRNKCEWQIFILKLI